VALCLAKSGLIPALSRNCKGSKDLSQVAWQNAEVSDLGGRSGL